MVPWRKELRVLSTPQDGLGRREQAHADSSDANRGCGLVNDLVGSP